MKCLALFLTVAMILTTFGAVVFASDGLEVIIDHDNPNVDPPINIAEFEVGGGSWIVSGITGAGHAGTPGTLATTVLGAWATWKPQAGILSDGTYEVWMFNPRRSDVHGGWDENVQLEVFNTVQGVNFVNKFYVNQKTVNNATDSSWVKLCTTQFSGDGNEYVKATRVTDASGTYTQVDRVKFVPVSSLETNAQLGSLMLAANVGGDVISLKIDQAVSPSLTEFTTRIPKLINGAIPDNLSVFAAAQSGIASISINDSTASSGYAQKDFVTVFGENKVKIEITSQDQTLTNTYNITILQEGDMVLVDDKLHADRFQTFGGGWTLSTAASVYDSPEVWALDNNLNQHWWTSHSDAYATFRPNLSASGEGTYEVFLWGSAHSQDPFENLLQRVDIEVTHSRVVEESSVAMNLVPLRWMYVGTYHFSGDDTEFIKVSRPTELTRQLRVSTIKLVKVPNNSRSNLLSAINIQRDTLDIVSESDFADGIYSFELPKTASEISFIISPVNSEAQITVNGDSVSAFSDIVRPVVSGENIFEIAITAEENTKVYTLNVNRIGEQINIAPDAGGVADGYSEGDTGWFKSGLAIGAYGGNNTRYTAVTGNWAKWSPDITMPGYYNIRLWNPVVSTPDGDPSALVEIKVGGKVFTTTVDWKTGPARWVDFGTYYFEATGDPQNRDQYIKLTKNTTGTGMNFRIDAASFTEVNVDGNDSTLQRIMFDNINLYGDEADGYNHRCYDMKQTLDIIAVANNNDAVVKINGEVIEGFDYTMPLKAGINVVNVSVSVGENTTNYVLTIVNPVIINEDDDEVEIAGPWQTSGTVKGYNESNSMYCGDSPEVKTITYPINAKGQKTVFGKTEVWVYKVVHAPDIDTGMADPAITYNIKEGNAIKTATVNGAEGTSGWVKLGTYNFEGRTDGSEYVELYREPMNAKRTRADAVKFVSVADLAIDYYGLLNNGSPQSYVSGGSLTGNLKFYNVSQISGTVTLILAKYNKYTGRLVETVISETVDLNASEITEAETPAIVLAHGDEELYNFRLFAFDDLINIKPILQNMVIE